MDFYYDRQERLLILIVFNSLRCIEEESFLVFKELSLSKMVLSSARHVDFISYIRDLSTGTGLYAVYRDGVLIFVGCSKPHRNDSLLKKKSFTQDPLILEVQNYIELGYRIEASFVEVPLQITLLIEDAIIKHHKPILNLGLKAKI